MTYFKIPLNHVHAFIRIGNMGDDEFSRFLKQISDESRQAVWTASEIAQTRQTYERHDSVAVDALTSLFLKWQYEDKIDSKRVYHFAENVKFSMGYWKIEESSLNLNALANRLEILFNKCKYLRATVKAMDLNSIGHQIFEDIQAITDIRPIFMNLEESLNNNIAVINHKLLFTVDRESGSESFEILCTREHLMAIQDEIERALNKDAALRNSGHFTYVDQ